MTYKNALIFIAGVACGVIGFWLVGILVTPNPSVSDGQPAASATDTPISSSLSQDKHSLDQTATANLIPQSTPTRTELLAYQMALRSGGELLLTNQRFYEKCSLMLPRYVMIWMV